MTLAAALARTHARAFTVDRGWTAFEFCQLLQTPGTIFIGDATAFVLGRLVLDEGEILTLATDPDAQRTGLARAALAGFEAAAIARDAVTIFLEVAADNSAAQQLYAAAGYAQIGHRPGYYARAAGPSVAALILRKTLSHPRIDPA